jgi:hypothetical protein
LKKPPPEAVVVSGWIVVRAMVVTGLLSVAMTGVMVVVIKLVTVSALVGPGILTVVMLAQPAMAKIRKSARMGVTISDRVFINISFYG